MPRKPTGNPRGRPPGTGKLDTPRRITVWLKGETYDRLEAYAEGRHYHRGAPQVATCVRELLEHALVCPYKHQTQNIPMPQRENNRRRENSTSASESMADSNYEQTAIIPLSTENNNRQIEKDSGEHGDILEPIEHVPQPQRQGRSAQAKDGQEAPSPALAEEPTHAQDSPGTVPAYDPTKYMLGPLCVHGHDFDGHGHSLKLRGRTGIPGACVTCREERQQAAPPKGRQVRTSATTPVRH